MGLSDVIGQSEIGPQKSPSFARWGLWWGLAFLFVASMAALYYDGLANAVGHWSQEEYSHGYLIPILGLLIAWGMRRELAQIGLSFSWSGLGLLAIAVVFLVIGELGSLYVLIHASFLISIAGLCLVIFGWRGMRLLWIPIIYLAFMFPVPDILYNTMSLKLQLISSSWGVFFIRMLGISVYLDGNVIDLGTYKLQVVEACSGLRYLFPLMSFGFVMAYLFRIPRWQKIVVFLSTIPLTVVMNSVRIGVVGILVEHFGIELAKGFIHDFEGWVIFMACVVVLFFEVWLLSLLSKPRPALSALISIDIFTNALPRNWTPALPSPSKSVYISAGAMVLAAGTVSFSLTDRTEIIPERTDFTTFPLKIGDWYGERGVVERSIIEAIRVDDFVMTNFRRLWDRRLVNFYVAYYESQRKGGAVHSPQACLPGGGWQIDTLETIYVDGDALGIERLPINRVIIKRGESRQLVYYWFKQRERHLTSSISVKWYMFLDSMMRKRSDGALVRFMTPIDGNEDIAQAEQRVLELLDAVLPSLSQYLPD